MNEQRSILAEVQAKPALERIEIALTHLYLSAILTRAETEWIAGLVRRNISGRPEVQERGFGL